MNRGLLSLPLRLHRYPYLPLHTAVERGNVEIMDLFIRKYEVDVN
jgi:Ankyrin repeat